MTSPIRTLLVAGALALAAQSPSPALAQEHEEPLSAARYDLPETEMFELAAKDGYTHRIFVSKPQGEPPENGYPVLYVLDGNAMFAAFAETRRNLSAMQSDLGKVIIIGVGYDTDKPYADRRLYDFTGPMPPPPPWDEALADMPSGGWDEFLGFLTGELRDEVDRRYGIDRARQALYGHSLGGLFAVHTLFEQPGAFHAIVAASPSLFWHDRAMLRAEEDFRARLMNWEIPKVARLRVVTGELEETVLERTDAAAFAKRIAPLSAFGLRSEFELFDGETHITVPVRSVTSTMRFVFAWP